MITLRSLLASVLLIAPHFSSDLQGGDVSHKSEIVIIGTIHKASPVYSTGVLVNILRRLKPDVLLCELDSSFFTKDFKLLEYESSSMEIAAIRTYLKETGIPIRPFDIEGRNAFYQKYDASNREEQLFRTIAALQKAKSLSPEADQLWEKIRSNLNRRTQWAQQSPESINSFDCDADLYQKWFFWSQGMAELIRLTPQLAEFREFQQIEESFEFRRNETMVKNIRQWSHEFIGKRIIVIVGFEHRHELRRLLFFQDGSPKYTLKEFWECH